MAASVWPLRECSSSMKMEEPLRILQYADTIGEPIEECL